MLTKEQMMLKNSRKIPISIMGSIPEFMATISSTIFSLLLGWEMIRRYCPKEIITGVENLFKKVNLFFNPNIQVSIHEFLGNNLKPHEAYPTVEAYLSINSSKTAKRLKAEKLKDSNKVVLSMDDYEKVTDEFQGVEVKWVSGRSHSWRRSMSMSISSIPEVEKKYFKLVFHKKHRELIFGTYLEHVIKTGTEIMQRNTQRKLYTNCHNRTTWSYIVFEHPATFDTLALEPQKKQEIVEDLLTFSKSKDFYARIGKAWKRGYLLYGPPGTGKSTMIAAMANLLNYDIYDLELTSVRDNTELRKLLSETSGKSIIVMEDIDCSLNLTGQRKKEQEKSQQKVAEKSRKEASRKEESGSKVTLSGLLNFIDGIWSACGGERIIVFTTNYVDKLDSALTRRGRMDKHIELSYCSFEAFKVLAKNYLLLESHPLFESIRQLMEVTKITPADVAENLMPKSVKEDAEKCLMNLIQTLQEAKTKQDQALDKEKAKQAMQESDDEAKKQQMLKESQKSKEALGEAKTKEAMKECDQALDEVETQQRLKEFQKSKEALEEAKQAMKELLELVLKEKIEMQKEPQESKEVLKEAVMKEKIEIQKQPPESKEVLEKAVMKEKIEMQKEHQESK